MRYPGWGTLSKSKAEELMLKKISKLLSEHPNITLIVSMVIMIIMIPYYINSLFAAYFNFLFLTLILLSAILTLEKSRIGLRKFSKAGYLIITINLIIAITENIDLELVSRILFILFLVIVAINLLIEIVKSKNVDTDLIFSAVAVYVLFGFCGAILAAVITLYNPDAFNLSGSSNNQFHQFFYFSYITITTTGYGDVLPLTPIAKTLAIFLALFGNLYLTVIIGILIGKYLSGSSQT